MLFCDVWRNLTVEIHSSDCKDVDRARARGFKTGTVECESLADVVNSHSGLSADSGIKLTPDCYRIMPCCRRSQ